MAKNGDVPRFFQLSPSKQISFKVPSAKGLKKLGDGNSIPDDAITPRKDFNYDFTINENSKLGVPKIYTPEQTYNYKSAWKRYEKGRELVETGKILKDKNDDDNNDNGNFKVLSSNAPKGYWRVTKKNPELNYSVFVRILAAIRPIGAANVLFPFGSSDDYFEGSAEYNQDGIYIKYDSSATIKQDEFGVSYYELNSSVEGEGQFQSISAGGRIGVISNVPAVSIRAVLEYSISIILTNVGLNYDQNVTLGANIFGASVFKEGNEVLIGGTIEGEGQSAPDGMGGDYGHGINFPNISYGFPPSSAYVKLTQKIKILEIVFQDGSNSNNGGGGGGEGEGDGDGDGEEDNKDWECDCPDSSKEKYISPTDTSGNEEDYKSWKDSDAGAIDGICKHIWAIRILNNQVGTGVEQFPIPTDMPIEYTPFPGDQSPQVAGNDGRVGFKNWKMNKTTRGDKF